MLRLHASAVSLSGVGVLITGTSGAGKSSLVIELLSRGAQLIADDQTELFAKEAALRAQPPESLSGLLELYGVGVIDYPHIASPSSCEIGFEVHLSSEPPQERLPERAYREYLGYHLPYIVLSKGEAGLVAAKTMLLAHMMQEYGELRLVNVAKPVTKG